LVSVVSIPALRSFYNGYVPLFFAEIVVFLPFALRVLSGALIQIDDSLLEAAVMSGASRIRAIRDVLVPLLRNAIGNAALLIFTLSLRELGAVVLLVGVNTTLLPSLMFEYWQNAQFGPTAALNILGALLPLAVAGAAWLLGKGVVVVVGQARASSAVQMGNASWAEADAS
jgi:iron(III) transport system permease protein